MKKKTINRLTLAGALGLGFIVLISCTANFAKPVDRASIMYAYDLGTTRYFATQEEAQKAVDSGNWKEGETKPTPTQLTIDDVTFDNIWCFQDYRIDYEGGVAKTLDPTDNSSVIYSAIQNKIAIPSHTYWSEIDKKVLQVAWTKAYGTDIKTVDQSQATVDKIIKRVEIKTEEDFKACGCLVQYGRMKFLQAENEEDNWKQWDTWTDEFRKSDKEGLGLKNVPNLDFTSLYKSFINTKVANVRSCITLREGEYGNFGYNHNKVYIEGKDWGYAWSKGFLEGLLVFPVAYLTETFSHSFGMGGWGQLGSILLVTFIVRTFIFLVSIRSTIGQQKMQMLQPEIAKLQAKYPNSDTNQAQKQRLSQEQMALYKKNKINPLGSLLTLIVQFPLFIGVWGAMQGSASLATDQVLGLYLSESIWNTLTNTQGLPSNVNGWWTALSLFILMAVAQFVSMKLPQWMQKHREKKLPKLSANPAQSKSQKQMKWFGYIMLVFIIIMGFTLPAGMGVYWLAGALFSILQTTITQLAISGTFKRWFVKIKGLFKKKEKQEVQQ